MTRPAQVPTAVWRIAPQVVVALDTRFGEPLDTYVNGSQTWLRDDGPDGIALEWRLHPVDAYERPAGVEVHEVFAEVAAALGTGAEPLADPAALWDGLEAFPAYDDETEPALLRAAVTDALGIEPDAAGIVDHGRIGDAWEQARGRLSIVGALLAELEP